MYFGLRTEIKGKEAAEKLKGEGIGNGDVIFLPCDLGSPASAKKAAEDFLQLETRLDILGMLQLAPRVFLNKVKIEQCQSITQDGTGCARYPCLGPVLTVFFFENSIHDKTEAPAQDGISEMMIAPQNHVPLNTTKDIF